MSPQLLWGIFPAIHGSDKSGPDAPPGHVRVAAWCLRNIRTDADPRTVDALLRTSMMDEA
jgi:hypothetical protein